MLKPNAVSYYSKLFFIVFIVQARLFTETFSRTSAIHPGIFLGQAGTL